MPPASGGSRPWGLLAGSAVVPGPSTVAALALAYGLYLAVPVFGAWALGGAVATARPVLAVVPVVALGLRVSSR